MNTNGSDLFCPYTLYTPHHAADGDHTSVAQQTISIVVVALCSVTTGVQLEVLMEASLYRTSCWVRWCNSNDNI